MAKAVRSVKERRNAVGTEYCNCSSGTVGKNYMETPSLKEVESKGTC